MQFPEHVEKILQTRYYLTGEMFKRYYGHDGQENWEMLCKRVCSYVSNGNDELYKEFYDVLYNREFLPNSPTLFGAGIPGLCLSACFVIPVEDSIEGWMESYRLATKVQTHGGGCGFPLHKIRPAGMEITGKRAKSAGPIAFMKNWNQISKSFSQGPRSGANMGQMRIDHPNIEEFIDSKIKDGELSAFNISVMPTDEFMNAVETNSTFDLKWDGVVFKTIKAKELWDKIIKNAWFNGDPGITFWDNVQKAKNPIIEGDLYGNPCLHGDMEILTKEYGLVKIKKLVGRTVTSFDYKNKNRSISKIWLSGNKPCVKLTLDSGMEIVCTEDHKWLTPEGKYLLAKELLGRKIYYRNNMDYDGIVPKEYKYHDFKALGFIFGDGGYHKASKRVKYVDIGSKDEDVLSYMIQLGFLEGNNGTQYIIKKGYCDNFFKDILPNRNLPEFIKYLPKEKLFDFINGLYSANGYVINDKKHNFRIVLKMTNKKLLQDIQKLLFIHGIKSNLVIDKGNKIKFSNGEYQCKDAYQLKIFDLESMKLFRDKIGFIHTYKNIKLENCINDKQNRPIKKINKVKIYNNYNLVVNIEPCGNHDVYDFTQDDNHCGNVFGFISHNCNEFNGVPLSACNLGSVNLKCCLTNNKQFDLVKLDRIVRTAYKFLNSVINVNHYPDPKIDEVVKKYRQIGIGVMGLHDVFLYSGYRYGDINSIRLTDAIFSKIRSAADDMNNSNNKQNANILSIAPTGTISMIAECSSGIEPYFSFEKMKRIINGKAEMVDPPYKTGDTYLDVGANDLSIDDHISITAIAQKYVDMSISKTINLPSTATVQDVDYAYMQSWKMGLKGITVYRDGSRANQTIQTEKTYTMPTESQLDSIKPIRCDGSLAGRRFKDKIGCGNIYSIINHDDNKDLVEVFIKPGKSGGCLSNVEALGRIITLALRCGVKVSEIVKQLKGIRCPSCIANKSEVRYLSCPDAVGRAIEYKYNKLKKKNVEIKMKIIDLTDIGASICPECKTKLIHESGCVRCICGYSKCG